MKKIWNLFLTALLLQYSVIHAQTVSQQDTNKQNDSSVVNVIDSIDLNTVKWHEFMVEVQAFCNKNDLIINDAIKTIQSKPNGVYLQRIDKLTEKFVSKVDSFRFKTFFRWKRKQQQHELRIMLKDFQDEIKLAETVYDIVLNEASLSISSVTDENCNACEKKATFAIAKESSDFERLTTEMLASFGDTLETNMRCEFCNLWKAIAQSQNNLYSTLRENQINIQNAEKKNTVILLNLDRLIALKKMNHDVTAWLNNHLE